MIGTLVELLQGRLSKAVMEMVTDRKEGLFPKPNEIKMRCSCPDYAGMCKHIAAVMYGVGNRLDHSPELLFVLRGVDHLELIEQAIPQAPSKGKGKVPAIAADDLGAIFDIEIGDAPAPTAAAKPPKKTPSKQPSKAKPSAVKAEAKAPKKSAAKASTKAKAEQRTLKPKAAAKPSGKLASKPASKKASAVKAAPASTKIKAKPASNTR